MIKRFFPLCLLLHGCVAVELDCWESCEDATPPYAGPPPSASTSRVSEEIAWDALEGHLAWLRDDGVLIADANDRTLTRLGFAGYTAFWDAMALSPDATRVAFGAVLHPTWEYRAFVVPTAGGETRRLEHEDFWGGWGTAWSPDGAGVYVTATPSMGSDGQDAVFFAQPDGSSSRTLPLGATRGSVAASPDGGRLAMGGDGIHVMDADGSAVTRISTPAPGEDEYGPAWSPDGEHIAFVVRRDPPSASLDDEQLQIVLVEPSGSAREVVLRFASDQPGCNPPSRVVTVGTKARLRSLRPERRARHAPARSRPRHARKRAGHSG